MQSSRHDTRGLAVLALVLCAALLTIECGVYFFRSVQDVDARGGKPTVISEFGAGVPVSQSFSLLRDGLHSITISLSSDQPALVAFDFSLVRRGLLADWPDEPITKRQITMSVPAGITKTTVDFPPVSRSKQRIFIATLKVADVMRQGTSTAVPHVSLVAFGDDALRGGALKVGGQDRWGALAIAVQADPPTRLARFRDSLNALVPLPLGMVSIALFGTITAALLAIVCYQGLYTLRRRPDDSPRTPDGLDERPIESGRSRPLRAAGTITFALATLFLFAVILASRERVTDDLLSRLDEARMESPLGMYGAFSRVEEVINGVSPPALFAHPPSRVTWSVIVPLRKPVFKASVALRPYVWVRPTDGVLFEVVASDGIHEIRKTRFLNPVAMLNDRAWVELDVDLAEFAGRTAQLSIATSPGPRGDSAWDWALWGNPRVVSLRWFDVYGRAMRDLNRDRNGD